MYIRAVACALPNPAYCLVFHSHIDEERARWNDQDLTRYLELQSSVEAIYRARGVVPGLKNKALEALYHPEIDLDEALQRLVPYVVEARRRHKSEIYLHQTLDQVQRLRMAGVGEPPPAGLRQVVLMKGTKGVRFRPSVALLANYQRLSRKTLQVQDGESLLPLSEYRPGSQVSADGQPLDMDSLSFRSQPALAAAVRNLGGQAAAYKGRCKLVTLPAQVDAYLSSDRSGEVVKEVARRWG